MPDGYLPECAHELFEKQAARTPDALAVRDGARSLTFGALNRDANRIAHFLQKHGVCPGEFVGLTHHRSLESVVCLLGILKAGGAWLYLDPTWPEARRQEMVADVRPLVILERDQNSVAESTENPISRVTPDDTAYLIYTSGSTGKPKAVQVRHRSITNRLASPPLPEIQPGDTCCLNSSHSFGISASRLFLPLAEGIPVIILRDDDVNDVGRFVDALQGNSVTSVFMVPWVLRQVLATPDLGRRLGHLRAIAVSGGVLTVQAIADFFRLLPNALLVNVYGGSEIGSAAAIRVLNAQSDLSYSSLGLPVVNTRIRIVNGEICIAAAHLSPGYLNLPSLTAEKFVPDEESSAAGARMYRTGDLGRALPNGEIEFLGRADEQIKIRGFRIESGEVESALHEQEEIVDAAVAAREIVGELRLFAWVVLREGVRISSRDVLEKLRCRLPHYMVPTDLFYVDRLSRTDNGKPDRRALALPDYPALEGHASVEVPSDGIESRLTAMWRQVLRAPVVGDEHFLDMGGDSLTMTLLIGLILGEFRVRLSFREFFLHATVREMSSLIRAKTASQAAMNSSNSF